MAHYLYKKLLHWLCHSLFWRPKTPTVVKYVVNQGHIIVHQYFFISIVFVNRITAGIHMLPAVYALCDKTLFKRRYYPY